MSCSWMEKVRKGGTLKIEKMTTEGKVLMEVQEVTVVMATGNVQMQMAKGRVQRMKRVQRVMEVREAMLAVMAMGMMRAMRKGMEP